MVVSELSFSLLNSREAIPEAEDGEYGIIQIAGGFT